MLREICEGKYCKRFIMQSKYFRGAYVELDGDMDCRLSLLF